jgi:hypothetical protein
MGQPPEGPTADKYIQVIAALYGDSPNDLKAFMSGIGFMELLKKMDLGKRQRVGADALGGQQSPQLSALQSTSPSSMAAPLAGMGGRPLGM